MILNPTQPEYGLATWRFQFGRLWGTWQSWCWRGKRPTRSSYKICNCPYTWPRQDSDGHDNVPWLAYDFFDDVSQNLCVHGKVVQRGCRRPQGTPQYQYESSAVVCLSPNAQTNTSCVEDAPITNDVVERDLKLFIRLRKNACFRQGARYPWPSGWITDTRDDRGWGSER